MNNNIQWTLLHKTKSAFEAAAMKGNLETQGIPAVIINKKDAVANTVGYVEIHVDSTYYEDALVIIKPDIANED